MVSNDGEARSRGFELEVVARSMAELNLSGSIGFLDAEFLDYEGFDGNTPANSPEYSANLSATYRAKSGIFIGCSLMGQGDAWADDENSFEKEGFWLANVKVGYERETWDLYMRVENLTDLEYFEFHEVSAMGAYSTVGQPRTVSVVASARF